MIPHVNYYYAVNLLQDFSEEDGALQKNKGISLRMI